jgi:hypothetical protein
LKYKFSLLLSQILKLLIPYLTYFMIESNLF